MKRTVVLTTTFAIYIIGMFALAYVSDTFHLPDAHLASIEPDRF